MLAYHQNNYDTSKVRSAMVPDTAPAQRVSVVSQPLRVTFPGTSDEVRTGMPHLYYFCRPHMGGVGSMTCQTM